MHIIIALSLKWLTAKYMRATLYNLLHSKQHEIIKPTSELQVLIIAWVIEWLLIIEYLFEEWAHTYILLAVRVPTIMLLCFLYWFWLWAMTVWRRTQFGKFTRGERKLWAKALAAFWVAELVTAGSFILIFSCLSWGPAPLVPRLFLVSRKGIILELIIYSYILLLAYIAKITMKWNTWRSQVILSSIILIMLSYILWKDVAILTTRENLYNQTSARWRNIRTNAVVYSISHEWWTVHATTRRSPHARQENLLVLLHASTRPDFTRLPQYSQYELHNIIESMPKHSRARALCPMLGILVDYTTNLQPLSPESQPFIAYPRRVGFVPKRIGIWHLLVIIKMWHHLILVLWWSLYIYKLLFRRKTAYAFLSSCAFNVYCCLILALLVYSLSFFQRWELFFKFKPSAFNMHRWLLYAHTSLEYILRKLTTWNNMTVTRI